MINAGENFSDRVILPFRLWGKAFSLIRKHPVILVPLVLAGIIDILILTVDFFYPQRPFLSLFSPVIRRIWGDYFLHYPYNFLLFPKLFSYGKSIAGFVTGVIFTGATVFMIAQAYGNNEPEFLPGLRRGLKRYGRNLTIWALTFLAVFMINRTALYLSERYFSYSSLAPAFTFMSGVAFQMCFVYAIPSVIVENRKVIPALKRNLALIKNNLPETAIFLFVPYAVLMPLLYVDFPGLMNRFSPEAAVYILLLKIILLTAADILIISGVTILLCLDRDIQRNAIISGQ
jgi:hypothetical protein